MIRLAVAGALGRMGKMILSLACEDKQFEIAGGLEQSKHPDLGKDLGLLLGGAPLGALAGSNTLEILKRADVLIDFTHPSAMTANLNACVRSRTSYVVGTTGLTPAQNRAIRTASKKIAIVQSPNMSIGVNLLFKLVEMTSRALDSRYDIEISETHHRMKKDAPSGTAMKLFDIIAEARSAHKTRDAIFGRQGETGVRKKGKIGVLAMRGGDVVGDHTVFYLGDGERIELTHRASSRSAFAQGALTASKFVVRHRNGLYNMSQVLGIE